MSFRGHIVQELCESRGGRPGLLSLIVLMVSVDIKQHSTVAFQSKRSGGGRWSWTFKLPQKRP